METTGAVIVAAIGPAVPIGMAAVLDPVPSPSLHPAKLAVTTRADGGAVGEVTIEAEVVRYMPRLLQANAGQVVRNVVKPREKQMKVENVNNSVAMAATTKNVAIVEISNLRRCQ